MACFQPPSLLFEKVCVPVMYFCAFPIHCKVHWRVCRRLGSYRLGRVLGPLLLFLYTTELFPMLENKLIGYADDSTSMAVVSSPGVRVTVTESMIRDPGKVNESCDL